MFNICSVCSYYIMYIFSIYKIHTRKVVLYDHNPLPTFVMRQFEVKNNKSLKANYLCFPRKQACVLQMLSFVQMVTCGHESFKHF